MADISFSQASASSSGGVLRRAMAGMGRVLFNLADAYSRADQIERLNALSDADLAARGLSRDAIPRYVYRDMIGM